MCADFADNAESLAALGDGLSPGQNTTSSAGMTRGATVWSGPTPGCTRLADELEQAYEGPPDLVRRPFRPAVEGARADRATVTALFDLESRSKFERYDMKTLDPVGELPRAPVWS